MGTDHKEKLIRVLQILEETDEKSPMNATQILKYLEEEYQIEQVDRRSVYRDIKMLQFCGYEIYQCADKKMGWYMKKHIFSDWEIKIMLDAVQQALPAVRMGIKSIKYGCMPFFTLIMGGTRAYKPYFCFLCPRIALFCAF